MTRRSFSLSVALATLVHTATGPAAGQPLVADLSSHLVAITTGFAGTQVLLFGAIEEEGDVVVLVRGPGTDTVVRRKGRFWGLWVNRADVAFAGVPAFYAVASSRPLDQVAPPTVRARYQLGVDRLRLSPVDPAAAGDIGAFRDALIRQKQESRLFVAEVGKVSFLGQRLFRTPLDFPSNLPTGAYSVEVLLLRGGEVVAAQTTPLIVSKDGFSAEVYDFAHDHAAFYGLLAVVLGTVAGWLGGVLFRRA
ncbi:MAG: hypothetical protein EXQ89_02250 [Rhodospirillaceae bacterium]|nr:hypothetical protein [Rhodospirillaceae bacterium]